MKNPKHLSRTWLISIINKVADFKSTTADVVQDILTHVSENYDLKHSMTEKEQQTVQDIYLNIEKDKDHKNWFGCIAFDANEMYNENSSFKEVLTFYIGEYKMYLDDSKHLHRKDSDLILQMPTLSNSDIYNFAFASAKTFFNVLKATTYAE